MYKVEVSNQNPWAIFIFQLVEKNLKYICLLIKLEEHIIHTWNVKAFFLTALSFLSPVITASVNSSIDMFSSILFSCTYIEIIYMYFLTKKGSCYTNFSVICFPLQHLIMKNCKQKSWKKFDGVTSEYLSPRFYN